LAEERGVLLQRVCAADLRVATDPDLLGHAVLNLVHNAIEHSPEGGRVRVEVRLVEDQLLELRVSDDGPGIAEEHRGRLFERFYRIDPVGSRRRGGFGLGLCIARSAVERLDGELVLEEAEGMGAVFLIRLRFS
jgi:signal transduction histidine kinase